MDNRVVEIDIKHYALSTLCPLYRALKSKTTEFITSSRIRVSRKYDITSISDSAPLLRAVILFLTERYKALGDGAPTHILSIESSGFILGTALAYEMKLPMLPLRRERIAEASFIKEDEDDNQPPRIPLSLPSGRLRPNSRVVIVDDFIGSGDTMASAMNCAQIEGATIVEAVAMCDVIANDGVKRIHKEAELSQVSILTLLHLRNSLDILFDFNNRIRSVL